MWSEIQRGADVAVSGHPAGFHDSNLSAEAKLGYDVAHSAPWGSKVSLYTWTKGIAAGAYLVPILLAVLGRLPWGSPVVRLIGPITSLVFLAVTGFLLIIDLKHPERFHLILLKGRLQSWLVRGAWGLMLFGAVVTLDLIAGITHFRVLEEVLAIPGIPLACLAALYTAFLFAQAKARDLWQSPLLPPHLVVQALLLGAVVTLFGVAAANPLHVAYVDRILSILALINLLMVVGEATITHPTAKAHLASYEMTRGRFRWIFLAGIILNLIAIATPFVGIDLGVAALLCILPLEHAFVQAGQAVPLA